ncbi:MAG: hypothetical protein QOF02_422 [Blastocatellia bacterium]|jgi:hypothetical protein|nr:hypothetical protein [Blastocatellia bacterium]
MKSCPTCNRTFEDTFTFCLADGSLLNAPFDPQATLVIPEPRPTEPPQTETLRPQEKIKQELAQTIASPQPRQQPEESVSSIAEPALKVALPRRAPFSAQPSRESYRSLLIMVGVGALLIIGLIIFINANRADSTNENAAKISAAPANATNTATVLNNNQTLNMEAPIPEPSSTPEINLEGTVWKGKQSGQYVRVYEFNAGGKVTEKASGKEGEKVPISSRSGSWTLKGNRVSMKFPTTKSDVGMEIEATIQGIGRTEMTGSIKWEERPFMHDTILVQQIK